MSDAKTIRVSQEVIAYLRKYGLFGESADEVLRRRLRTFKKFLEEQKDTPEGK